MINQFLGSWQFHVRSWIEQEYKPLLLIKYEELLTIHFKILVNYQNFLI